MKALLAATLLLPAVTAHSAHAAPARTDHQVLARVELTKSRTELRLPVHAWLLDARGVEYLLVLARENDIALSGAHYMVIDTNAGNRAWLIVMPKARRARQRMLDMAGVLYDDGRQFIARADGTNAEYYAGHGCEIERMSATPLVFPRQAAALGMPAATPKPLAADPLVASLMAQVAESNLYRELAGLTGVEPVTIGGETVVITSRHTTSGVPFQKDTQYAFERLGALGLDVSYHYWTKSGYSNRNVIAVKPGTTRPDEKVLVCAHIDDMPGGPVAPGADDNGSGAVAVMTIATLVASQAFDRTIEFDLFTGEEQGLLGSSVRADLAYAGGENIIAVYNMDMLGWDVLDGPVARLHTRTPGNPMHTDDFAVASVFVSVVDMYGLSNALTPVITSDGETASDHSSFWNKGYAGILAIEDDYDDFHEFYHTTNDVLALINLPYYTAFVKASLGSSLHMAGLVPEPCAMIAVLIAACAACRMRAVR